jgi:hypothetical protein
LQLLQTHPHYRDAIEKPYEKLCEEVKKDEKKLRPAVVLDAFAGVGTGILVLKRLGIAMKKIIHVEKDLVASHVHRYNHDTSYNETLPDDGGIEHVYEYTKWEDLADNDVLDDFLKKHGRKLTTFSCMRFHSVCSQKLQMSPLIFFSY